MNYNSGKTIFGIIVIIIVFIVSFFFFKMFTLQNEVSMSDSAEKSREENESVEIVNEINLDLLESNKFINLKGEGSGSSTFKAGRRNPFEPYEQE